MQRLQMWAGSGCDSAALHVVIVLLLTYSSKWISHIFRPPCPHKKKTDTSAHIQETTQAYSCLHVQRQNFSQLCLLSPLSHALFSPLLSSVTNTLQTIHSMSLTNAEGHGCFQTDHYARSNGRRADHSKSELTAKH